MIPVRSIYPGCQWDASHQVVRPWPLRIEFGARGNEVTVDEMLKGYGFTVLPAQALVALVRGIAGLDTLLLLIDPPEGIAAAFAAAGYCVKTQGG